MKYTSTGRQLQVSLQKQQIVGFIAIFDEKQAWQMKWPQDVKTVLFDVISTWHILQWGVKLISSQNNTLVNYKYLEGIVIPWLLIDTYRIK